MLPLLLCPCRSLLLQHFTCCNKCDLHLMMLLYMSAMLDPWDPHKFYKSSHYLIKQCNEACAASRRTRQADKDIQYGMRTSWKVRSYLSLLSILCQGVFVIKGSPGHGLTAIGKQHSTDKLFITGINKRVRCAPTHLANRLKTRLSLLIKECEHQINQEVASWSWRGLGILTTWTSE